MTPSPAIQANLDLVMRAGTLIHTGFANPDENMLAHDFVFHYVNPRLAALNGDHHGYDGFRSVFEQLHQGSDTGFHNEPHSLTPYGDELVVAYATNTVGLGGTALDVDAIVVWRIVDGRISEAWTSRRSTPCARISRTRYEPAPPRRSSVERTRRNNVADEGLFRDPPSWGGESDPGKARPADPGSTGGMMELTGAREAQLRRFFRWLNRRMLLMWRLGLGSHFADPTVGYIMVLTTTGRKSGERRRAPLNFAVEGETVQCLAGFGGATHWLLNLQSDPRCEVWLPDGRRMAGRGEMVSDEMRRIALIRQILIRSGFAAKLAHPGLDLAEASDEQIALLGLRSDRRYEVVEIKLGDDVAGPGGPGDLRWVRPAVGLAGLALLLAALRSRWWRR